MSINIPTTAQIQAQNQANIEGRLNQTTPAANKAFNTVVATTEAMMFTSTYKYAQDRILAVLASTSQGSDLDIIGVEYGTPRAQAVACVASITVTSTPGTVIPALTYWTSPTGGQYYTTVQVTTTGTDLVGVTAFTPGSSSTLSVNTTLTVVNQIAGMNITAPVSSVTMAGADTELDPAYAARLLVIIQRPGGGGSASDYKAWTSAVSGVANAYPFTGPPAGSGITPEPPQRTVYVEANANIDPSGNGIATSGLLAAVTTAIQYDPNTGLARQPLGMTMGTLYVQSVIRTGFYVQISSLVVPSGQTSACQAGILAALTTYYLSVHPFCDGVEPVFQRNDQISQGAVAQVMQGVCQTYGAYFTSASFGTSSMTGPFLSNYQLGQNEKAKLLQVAYL